MSVDVVDEFDGDIPDNEREEASELLDIDKARKAAAAKAAKVSGSAASADATTASAPSAGKKFVMTPEKRARFEAKLEGRSPEQIEKARACLAAKEAAASAPAATESTAPAEKPTPAAAKPVNAPVVETSQEKDADLEAKLSIMDADKAAKVREALSRHASMKGGE